MNKSLNFSLRSQWISFTKLQPLPLAGAASIIMWHNTIENLNKVVKLPKEVRFSFRCHLMLKCHKQEVILATYCCSFLLAWCTSLLLLLAVRLLTFCWTRRWTSASLNLQLKNLLMNLNDHFSEMGRTALYVPQKESVNNKWKGVCSSSPESRTKEGILELYTGIYNRESAYLKHRAVTNSSCQNYTWTLMSLVKLMLHFFVISFTSIDRQ